ncbi:MAG: SET domain-containing protein-lysine N-methyltransferase [Candidatus Pacebacteria bacterium]|nr:SET domain-containing protein-lysine N-methyltransferase [Candidatus Paceibacterota bacterium]
MFSLFKSKIKPPREDWVNPKIEICETKKRGKGLFASQPINKGTVVIIWGGNYVNKKQADIAKNRGMLVMQFDDNLFSIEDRGESDAYFINHSCNPNVWMKDAFRLETMRDVKIGEELTADYILWETDENKISKWKCECGAFNCRQVITGKDYLLPELQKKV